MTELKLAKQQKLAAQARQSAVKMEGSATLFSVEETTGEDNEGGMSDKARGKMAVTTNRDTQPQPVFNTQGKFVATEEWVNGIGVKNELPILFPYFHFHR